jgi:cyclopropane fatty-acyl-phospholipid synthase-like methyltransferase
VAPVSFWDKVYLQDSAPWDIGRPQEVFVRIADAGDVSAPVLDSGCGTGEHALLFASRGLSATGVDLSAPAIEMARAKAARRGLRVRLEVADVLALEGLRGPFATVIDSGMFHVFNDGDRSRYVAALSAVTSPGAVVYLLCFSDHAPGDHGPRQVTHVELRAAFADGWEVWQIEESRFEVRPDFPAESPHAWFATIVRT